MSVETRSWAEKASSSSSSISCRSVDMALAIGARKMLRMCCQQWAAWQRTAASFSQRQSCSPTRRRQPSPSPAPSPSR
eukprot:6194791-Prymnesium_polylepis.1